LQIQGDRVLGWAVLELLFRSEIGRCQVLAERATMLKQSGRCLVVTPGGVRRSATEIDRNSEFIQNQIVHSRRGSNSGCGCEPETSEAVE
jgi:hypothetical protein